MAPPNIWLKVFRVLRTLRGSTRLSAKTLQPTTPPSSGTRSGNPRCTSTQRRQWEGIALAPRCCQSASPRLENNGLRPSWVLHHLHAGTSVGFEYDVRMAKAQPGFFESSSLHLTAGVHQLTGSGCRVSCP